MTFTHDRNQLGFDDVSPEAAETLAREWGYDECNDSWGMAVGWATGLLHEESDDD